jgi:transcriptional regulator with XRE-family HTH domain
MNKRTANQAIAKLRRRTGTTQHVLAAETGIGLNRIVFYETGRTELLPEEVDKIRKVLKQRARQTAADAVGV